MKKGEPATLRECPRVEDFADLASKLVVFPQHGDPEGDRTNSLSGHNH